MSRPLPKRHYPVPDHQCIDGKPIDPNILAGIKQLRPQLGPLNTADDVAAWLRSKGIKGRRNCGEYCPMAVLMKKELGTDGAVANNGFQFADMKLQLAFPPEIQKFIIRFDAGYYPDLEEEVAAAAA